MRHLSVGKRLAGAALALCPFGVPAVVVTALPAVAEAQTATGNVRGRVTATGGAGASAAIVTARNVENNQTRTTTTNESGTYYMGGLRPGSYEIIARRVGLTPQTRNVVVQIGQTADVDFALGESAVTLQAVTVTAAARPEETTRTSEIGTNVSRTQIENLPNFERNFLDIARLAPGITAQPVNSTNKTFAAAGQPAEAVNVFVDGATYKSDVLTGGVAGQDASKGNPFPQDAVQEFRVVTQNYKAEYQKAGSAIITATTRSGTNDLEFSAFGFNTQPAYVSPNAIDAARNFRPQYKRWQAGASIGGPIKKDELFYFATYELNQRREPASVLFGGDSTRAPAALLNQLRPYTGGFSQDFLEHLGFAKLTWTPSGRNTVDGSVSIRTDRDFRGFGGQTSYEAREDLDIDVYTGVANWRHAGDRWLNEAQVTTQYYTWSPTWINGDLVGRNYNGVLRIGGKDTQQEFAQTRISLRDDISRGGVEFLGQHVFKMGGNVDFLNYRAVKAFNANPTFQYRFEENWAQPFRANFGFGDDRVETDNTQFGVYVQDDWSIGSRLVLNLGLRWDAETNMINNDYVTPQPLADSLRGPLNDRLTVNRRIPDPARPSEFLTEPVNTFELLGGLERFISTGDNRPIYKKAFQPRLGASFDVFADGRTVVFGGYGIYFDRNYWNSLLDEQFRRQYGVYTVDFRATQALCDAESDAVVRSRCTTWDERYLDPTQLRTLSGSVGAPEVFMVANDLQPPRTEQFSGGIRQTIGSTLWTVSYNGVRGRNYMNFIRGAYALPGTGGNSYSSVFITDDRVKTWYDALQVQVDRPFREDTWWGGSIAYTLGKSEQQGNSTELFWGFDERFPTVADRPRLRAPGDQRHRVVANGVFRLPAEIIFSTIVNLGSGITQIASDQTEGTGVFQSVQYPYTPPSRPFLGIGNVFATQQVDMRLEKPIALGNGQNLSIVADIFNAFNNKNYGCFNATIFPRGQVNENFGTPGCAGLGWRAQFGVRYGYRANPILANGGN